jgi:hypothetical protein
MLASSRFQPGMAAMVACTGASPAALNCGKADVASAARQLIAVL